MLDLKKTTKNIVKKIIPLRLRMQLIQTNKRIFAPILRPWCLGKGHIFMLHRVHPANRKLRLGGLERYHITPEGLEQTIQILKARNYLYLSMDEIYQLLPRR